MNFTLHVLWLSKNEFRTYQTCCFKNQSGKLTELLDCLFEDKHGQLTVFPWMEPQAIELVSDKHQQTGHGLCRTVVGCIFSKTLKTGT